MPRHALTDLNIDARTATCSVCGPNTTIKRRPPRGPNNEPWYRCMNKWREENRNHVLRSNTPDAVRLRRYGISQDEYQALQAKQGNTCAICRKRAKLHVDHDHTTGAIRGLLCGPCNRALGIFGDDIAGIEDILRYLKS